MGMSRDQHGKEYRRPPQMVQGKRLTSKQEDSESNQELIQKWVRTLAPELAQESAQRGYDWQ